MENKYILELNNEEDFTREDIQKLATDIFSNNYSQLKEIADMPYYKKVLNCVKIQGTSKRLIVDSIKDISTLQSLFLELYIKDQNEEQEYFEKAIDILKSTNEKLYKYCVARITEQEELSSLNDLDSEYLLQLLAELNNHVSLEKKSNHRNHMAIVSEVTRAKLPDSKFNYENLRRLKNPKLVYRFFVEHCVLVDLNPKNLPEDIEENCINEISVSPNEKKEIIENVIFEWENYTAEYFLYTKYSCDSLNEPVFEDYGDYDNEELVDDAIEEDLSFYQYKNFVKNNIEGFGKRLAVNTDNIKKSFDNCKVYKGKIPFNDAICYIAKTDNVYFIFTVSSIYSLKAKEFSVIRYDEIDYNKISINKEKGKFYISEKTAFDLKNIEDTDRLKDFCAIIVENISGFDDKPKFIVDHNDDIKVLYLKLLYNLLQSDNKTGNNKIDIIFLLSLRYGVINRWNEINTPGTEQFDSIYEDLITGIDNQYLGMIALQFATDFFFILNSTNINTTIIDFFNGKDIFPDISKLSTDILSYICTRDNKKNNLAKLYGKAEKAAKNYSLLAENILVNSFDSINCDVGLFLNNKGSKSLNLKNDIIETVIGDYTTAIPYASVELTYAIEQRISYLQGCVTNLSLAAKKDNIIKKNHETRKRISKTNVKNIHSENKNGENDIVDSSIKIANSIAKTAGTTFNMILNTSVNIAKRTMNLDKEDIKNLPKLQKKLWIWWVKKYGLSV